MLEEQDTHREEILPFMSEALLLALEETLNINSYYPNILLFFYST